MSPHVPPSDEVLDQQALDHARSCGCWVCRLTLLLHEAINDPEVTPSLLAARGLLMAEGYNALIGEAARRIIKGTST